MMMNNINAILELGNNTISVLIVIIAFIIISYQKIKQFTNLSKEAKINIAKEALKENLLKYMSDAEIEWSSYEKAGAIKRSQVIAKIYEDYPILKECVNQEELIQYIDKEISELKITVNAVITASIEK